MSKLQIALATAVLLMVGCQGGESAGGADRAEVAERAIEQSEDIQTDVELPDGPWRDLAHRLVASKSLDDSVGITREILARGGIATHDGTAVLVAAQGPAATFTASPRETVHLAMEARRRPNAGRMTIAELAQMLEGFGFPFPDANPNDAGHGAVDRSTREPNLIDTDPTGARDNATREAKRAQDIAQDEAARARIQEATQQWQLARQAVNRAAAADRAAAQDEVDRLWKVRNDLIAQRNTAQLAARDERDALRDHLVAQREQARRMKRVQRMIGADFEQGERVMALLDAWVREAVRNPDDPRNFTPLFLAEMARLQDAPVDLTGSRWTRPGRGGEGVPVDLRAAPRSQQLRWTLLELQLFGAAFDRGRAPSRAQATTASIERATLAVLDSIVPQARANNACIDYKKAYGETWGEVAGTAGGWGVGQALDRGIKAAVDDAAAEAFGKAMNAIGIATKLAKLASFYGDNQVYVVAEPLSIHKPTGVPELAMYVARVGLDEEAVKEYERQIKETSQADRVARDCLSSLGFPTSSDLADMAKEAEDWLVEWRLADGDGYHVHEAANPTNEWHVPGRRAMKLRRESATSLRADYFIEVLPEDKHSGKIARAYATAEARVDAAGMPSLGTFVTGAAGGFGLAEALVELVGGWFQFMNMPKAYATIEIEYHCERVTTLHRSSKPVADGAGDPEDCVIAADGNRRINAR